MVTFAATLRKGAITRFFSSYFGNSTGVDLRSTTITPQILMHKNPSCSSMTINSSSTSAGTKLNTSSVTSISAISGNSAITSNNNVHMINGSGGTAASNASNNISSSNSCNKQARYDFYLGTNKFSHSYHNLLSIQ